MPVLMWPVHFAVVVERWNRNDPLFQLFHLQKMHRCLLQTFETLETLEMFSPVVVVPFSPSVVSVVVVVPDSIGCSCVATWPTFAASPPTPPPFLPSRWCTAVNPLAAVHCWAARVAAVVVPERSSKSSGRECRSKQENVAVRNQQNQ